MTVDQVLSGLSVANTSMTLQDKVAVIYGAGGAEHRLRPSSVEF
jgi:hypothetical protein